ncbi:MAG: hypothetical protein MK041_03395 [Aquabacterium sp.]|nr:hypothetical protein [Aquabacterium sp.]
MTTKTKTGTAEYRVVADKLWHSSECRMYHKGDTVTLPAGLKLTEDSAVEPIEPVRAAKKADDLA